MEKLPQELILEIFEHLEVTDLINLSKINTRFKEIVRSSPRKWKFNLKFDKKGKIESERTQRFGQLTVKHFNPRSHQPALQICGSNITSITFTGSVVTFPFAGTEIKYPDIAMILRICQNLQHVKFENLIVWPEVIKHMPQNNGIHVEIIESSSCILDLFLKCRVSALWITSKDGEYGTGIRGFLRSQPYLKTILCQGQKVLDLFYAMGNSYGENYEALPFQLKILSMRDVYFKPYYMDILMPSASSLTYLTIADIDPLWQHHLLGDFIAKCSNLEELSLRNFAFLRLKPPTSITRVTLCDYVGPAQWISDLTNLKSLVVMSQTHSVQTHAMEFNFAKNSALENVTISSAVIKSSLDMPYVKKLKLKDIRDIPDGQELIRNLCRIEEIQVENCGNVTDKIVKDIARRANNVRNLSICDGTITNETLRYVRGCCGNMKDFVMRNVKVEDELVD
ncbi:unnamed protein product [Chironomus riparius]|uniref:F-box domain-containing protein n=1 Tax=Chironomus riparius TaxID=315576 RepID=A0A9N9WYT3_9DIPT|nr:unnamed protein product [Chironomus riparius]